MCSFNKLKYDLFIQHLETSYNAADLVDKLDIPIDTLLNYLTDYIMDNLQVFTDDLITLGICDKGDMDD